MRNVVQCLHAALNRLGGGDINPRWRALAAREPGREPPDVLVATEPPTDCRRRVLVARVVGFDTAAEFQERKGVLQISELKVARGVVCWPHTGKRHEQLAVPVKFCSEFFLSELFQTSKPLGGFL